MLHDFSMALNNSKHHPLDYQVSILKALGWTLYGTLAESMRISHRTLLDYVIPIQGQDCTPKNSDFLTNSSMTKKNLMFAAIKKAF